MPVEHDLNLNIACDNPACPGNDLDPADRTGWLFVSTEVYGEPTQQHVFCSSDCAGTSSELFNTPEELKAPLGPTAPPDEPEPVTRKAVRK